MVAKKKLAAPRPAKPNLDLLKQQGKEHNRKHIENMYDAQFAIYKVMGNLDDKTTLRTLDKTLTEIEFVLQDLWGFERNANFHRFWYRPKCSCSRMDNEDRYGTNTFVRNLECVLHGND